MTLKVGSGAKAQTTVEEVTELSESYVLNKKQRRKLWHQVAKKDSFLDYQRQTTEKKLREKGLYGAKATKKLGITDITQGTTV